MCMRTCLDLMQFQDDNDSCFLSLVTPQTSFKATMGCTDHVVRSRCSELCRTSPSN
eukprot:m.258281 g.258281  ORF g.258281 m.258281 type:complete len:56 (+) comp15538_c0_seq3:239-406(+)